MKKVFTLLTVAAVFTFTSCGEGTSHDEAEGHADSTEMTHEEVSHEEMTHEEEAPAMEEDTMTIVDQAVEAGEEMVEEGADAVEAIEEMAH